MKLLILRETNGDNACFKVFDECENLLFNVIGKDSHGVRQLKAFTSEDKCVIKISATPQIGSTTGYNVITPHHAFAVTVKLKAADLCLKIHGAKFFFRGNLYTRSFEITDVSSKAMACHKPEAGKSGRYILDVFEESQVLSLLAISICADTISFSDSAAICRA